MSTLGWVLLIAGILVLGTLIFLVIKFWAKIKPFLLKMFNLAKKLDWGALYDKARNSGVLDKVYNFVESRKKKN